VSLKLDECEPLNAGSINQGAALTLMFPGSIAHRLSGIAGAAWPAAFAQAHGRAVHADRFKPVLKAP